MAVAGSERCAHEQLHGARRTSERIVQGPRGVKHTDGTACEHKQVTDMEHGPRGVNWDLKGQERVQVLLAPRLREGESSNSGK